MFLMFGYSWSKEKDADKFLLDGNHANSFLVKNKRATYVPEGCDTEEFIEIWGVGIPDIAERKRKEYVAQCC
ncbi:hypothetical protein ACROYT_G031252 [Oculina patagonica]